MSGTSVNADQSMLIIDLGCRRGQRVEDRALWLDAATSAGIVHYAVGNGLIDP